MRRILCLLCWLLAMFAAFGQAAAAAQAATHRPPEVTERILYRFKGAADGAHPQSGVVMDNKGNLYGVTHGRMAAGTRGCRDCGTVFEISHGTHAETVLHRFSGGTSDGAYPTAGLLIGNAGNLYGTTSSGGDGCTSNYLIGCGTVFEISARSREKCISLCGTKWQITSRVHDETIMRAFSAGGGWSPDGGLLIGPAGDFYGTTSSGGCGNGTYGCGTVFEITAGTRNVIVLHTFSRGADIDGFPTGRLVMDRSGDLYGLTWSSNVQHHVTGILFEILAATHKEKTLHTFTGGRDGDDPDGGLIIDSKGNLYGTTQFGGRACMGSISEYVIGCGTVFEIVAGSHKEKILHRFKAGGDGSEPEGGLAMDRAGNLYGTTFAGGGNCHRGCGTVFEIAANTHEERILYRFKGGRDGDDPEGDLLIGRSGNLYGTTFRGGTNCRKMSELGPGCGTVFEIVRR